MHEQAVPKDVAIFHMGGLSGNFNDLATRILTTAEHEAQKCKQTAEQGADDAAVRTQFLRNTMSSVKQVTGGSKNIIIAFDYEDDVDELGGKMEPVNIIQVPARDGRKLKGKVVCFDSGRYSRKIDYSDGSTFATTPRSEKQGSSGYRQFTFKPVSGSLMLTDL